MSRSEWTNNPNHIRRYRKQRNLRMRDVARLVGIRDGPHISQWESGSRTPTLESALKLSAALGCPVEVLFSDHFREIREEVDQRRERFNIKREYSNQNKNQHENQHPRGEETTAGQSSH